MKNESFYDKDADLSILRDKKVAIIGYGSQGHAHALNLKDSGVQVTVGLRDGSNSIAKAKNAGLTVKNIPDAVKDADVVMILAPDEQHKKLYQESIEPNLKPGATLAVAHGFSIHFGFIKPRTDLDVIMIAPKGPGHLVRSTFTQGGGVPCLIAVKQDASGKARSVALSYASAVGGGRAGIIETTFRTSARPTCSASRRCCAAAPRIWCRPGSRPLVEAGYPPEMAYFECLHELKLIVDLMYEGGIANMRYSISNTAEYGDYTRGPRIVNEQTKAEMKRILTEIQSGQFAREWMAENETGGKRFPEMRAQAAKHPIEEGRRQAARHDAVDQGPSYRRQVQELIKQNH